MKKRIFGKTGWPVSEIGFGAWGIGKAWWGPTEDKQSLSAIQTAWDNGVTFYDTAYVYGDGHSEKLLGDALKGKDAVLATKIPPKNWKWPPDPKAPMSAAFPKEWIISCTERSLSYLKKGTLSLTQFHAWTDDWIDNDEWKEAIFRLKKQGKIKAFGVSINDHQPDSALKLVASGLIDSVQVIFNIFEQAPAKTLFPLCQKHHVGVIARVPVDEGALTGQFTKDTKFKGDDFRAKYFGDGRLAQAVDRVENLKPLLSGGTKGLSDLALKYILGHEAVSVVIPGMRSNAHVLTNTAVSESPRLNAETMEKLRAHAWPRNFYDFWD